MKYLTFIVLLLFIDQGFSQKVSDGIPTKDHYKKGFLTLKDKTNYEGTDILISQDTLTFKNSVTNDLENI